MLILHLLATFCLGLSCERMTARVRSLTFRNVLRQGVNWFNKEKNAPGSLVSFLSNECANMAGVHALTLGIFLSTLTSLLLGGIVSFLLDWRLALASVSVIPLLLLSGYLRFALLDAFQRKLQTHHIRSDTYALEMISSIQTVAALVQEEQVLAKYSSILEEATSMASKSVHKEASLFAVSQALTYFANTFIIWYDAKLVGEHRADLYAFFVCFIAIVFGVQDAGESFSRSPALHKGLLSAQNVTKLYRRGPLPSTQTRSMEAKASREDLSRSKTLASLTLLDQDFPFFQTSFSRSLKVNILRLWVPPAPAKAQSSPCSSNSTDPPKAESF